MAIQKTRFGFPTRSPRQVRSRTEIFRPVLGLHVGDVPQDLMPGFTPESLNFVTEAGYITPRSGLSQFGGYSFGQPVLGGAELPDAEGNLAAVALSASSIAMYHPSTDTWSQLSYVRGSTLTQDDLPSGLSTDYWSTAAIFDPEANAFMAVLSNGTNYAKWFHVDASTATYSDFTWAEVLEATKTAKAVAAVNDRLVFFNTVSSQGTKYPTRLVYSARGNPRSFLVADGAGAIDLMDMRGEGVAAIKAQDQLFLFTDEEIWRAVPTLDDYAFRVERVSDRLGCPYPRTIAASPIGIIFLARDLEVYVLSGTQVVPLGPPAPGEPSRIQPYLRRHMIEGFRAWAAFNAVERRYELYFSTRESMNGFPVRALYYNIDDQSWMPQKFAHELSFGFDLEDPGTPVTWEDLEGFAWDELNQAWDSFGRGADQRHTVAFGSGGTAYRLYSGYTNDDGIALEARWRSHALSQADQMRQKHLTELWIDYETEVSSEVGVHLSNDLGQGFQSSRTVQLSPGRRNQFVPVWITGQAPMFEIRVADGSRPKIARFQASLTDAGKFGGR